jgi:hypothetical protein
LSVCLPAPTRRVTRQAILVMRAAISNPVNVKNFLAFKLEDYASAAPARDAENRQMWLGVARSMALTEAQRADVIQLRRLFLSALFNIISRRKVINASLLQVRHAAAGRCTFLSFVSCPKALHGGLVRGEAPCVTDRGARQCSDRQVLLRPAAHGDIELCAATVVEHGF